VLAAGGASLSINWTWLRYCGHRKRFSRNIFIDATNAFSTAPGVGTNVVTG
jgi:hypothetical protein